MSLSTRLTIVMVLLVAFTAVAVGFLSYQSITAAVLPAELTRLDASTRLQATSLEGEVAAARADVIAVAKTGVTIGVAAAHAAGGKDPRDGTPEAVWSRRLARLLEAELRAKPEYTMFRLIGIADKGRELIRVDRTGPNDDVRIVEDSELRTQGDRNYLRATLALRPGDVHVTPITLNELDLKDTALDPDAHVPFIRVSTPVAGSDGKIFGILIINIDMRAAFSRVVDGIAGSERVFVVNEAGDYLVHPDSSREFGFNLGHRYRMQEEYPELSAALNSGEAFQGTVTAPSGAAEIVAYVPLKLGGGPRIGVIETMPVDSALASAEGVQRASILGGFLAALAAALIAAWVARSMSHPLIQMAHSVSHFTGEETLDVPQTANGEIGTLARAFARMAGSVREKTAALQDEIAQRTKVEERERLFVAAVESANDAIVTSSVDGKFSNWNAGAQRMFGYSAKEAIGQPISLIVPPDREQEQKTHRTKLTRGEGLTDVETVRVAKDGTLREVSVTLSPIMDSTGKLVNASAIYRDIGPRKQAEQLFRLAVEAAPNAMIVAGADGLIKLVNAETGRMFGYEPDELIGKYIEILIPAKLRANHERERAAYAENPDRRAMGKGRDLFGVRKNGSEFAVEVGLNPIATPEGPMVMASVLDISERKHQELLLKERAEELQRSNAELEQFAYVASHDLQEPLRMVASYAELLGERYSGKLDAKADKYIGYAVDGAKRMQRLVNDLLTFSRTGRHEIKSQPTDLNKLVADVVKNLDRAAAEAKAEIKIPSLPVVLADPVQMTQIFQNLIGNAIKFHGDTPPVVTLGAERHGSGWKFSVGDNGIGIEEQYSDRIFQMFQRLHDRASYEGNGIGLPIAKKIVERHGGRIWFESAPGQGTTFYFILPQAQEKAA